MVNSSCKGVGCTPRPLMFPAVQWRRSPDGTPRDKKDPKKADPAVFSSNPKDNPPAQ